MVVYNFLKINIVSLQIDCGWLKVLQFSLWVRDVIIWSQKDYFNGMYIHATPGAHYSHDMYTFMHKDAYIWQGKQLSLDYQ